MNGRSVKKVIFGALALFAAQQFLARSKPEVTFVSECSCEGNHGVSRWAAKTDDAPAPTNNIEIQQATPADLYSWQGPGVHLTHSSPRIPAEQKWYAVTGRIEKVRVEDDGDLHVVMNNTDGRLGSIVVELPLGTVWCEMRKTVFSWTNARFPFHIGENRLFHQLQNPVVTVIGKAFYDIDHLGKSTGDNRRSYDQSLAVWEIHPVMQLSIGNSKVSAAPPLAQPQGTPQIQPRVTPQIAAAPTRIVPTPTAEPEQFVTITQPLTIKIPYGQTVLQRGMKLPVVSRDAQTVSVRYMNQIYPIPVSSTDLR